MSHSFFITGIINAISFAGVRTLCPSFRRLDSFALSRSLIPPLSHTSSARATLVCLFLSLALLIALVTVLESSTRTRHLAALKRNNPHCLNDCRYFCWWFSPRVTNLASPQILIRTSIRQKKINRWDIVSRAGALLDVALITYRSIRQSATIGLDDNRCVRLAG